ncbi:MAG: acylneuraminate cytidylyltransferase family protein [Candidatus Pacebacteria bacterium]|nr:acylneuraminate cytidylyltransferase family protein [Candidatus Paceibacterota bacterium]
MEVLAIIPARGGSKGVPRKNIKPLAGKPLIAWAIEAAKATPLVTRVVVSTEDDEIASVARTYGAEVPFVRPPEFAKDLSTTLEVLEHALLWFATHEEYAPDIVLLLPPTAPLVLPSDITQGIEPLTNDPSADSVRPIVPSAKHPYKNLRIENGYLRPFYEADITGFEEPYDMPRQLFPDAYVYSGAFQVIRTKTILEYKSLSGARMRYIHMPLERSVNIDTLDDFKYADMLMRERIEQHRTRQEDVSK